MAKNRKTNHNNGKVKQYRSLDAFKHFQKSLDQVMKKVFGFDSMLYQLNIHEKWRMFLMIWHVNVPKRLDGNAITGNELKIIGKLFQKIIRSNKIYCDDHILSILEVNMLTAFRHALCNGFVADERADAILETIEFPDDLDEDMIDTTHLYLSYFMRLITRLSDVRKKYYSFTMEFSVVNNLLGLSLTPVVSSYWARRSKMMIHGRSRPVYKIAVPVVGEGIDWVQIPSELLGEHYHGDKPTLSLYMQSHAFNRMKERLDAFDQMTLNHILWLNMIQIESFEHYKGYLLLPVEVYDIKIGYLACNVVGEVVVIRSFLFLTHSCTPEGDKLKSMSGLGRSDITYWKIDRLSTLLGVNPESSADLYQLFSKAGIEDIFTLKDFDLDIEAVQHANLNGFVDYIKQGQKETGIVPVEEPVEELVETIEEKKSVFDYFDWKSWVALPIALLVFILFLIIKLINFVFRKIRDWDLLKVRS